MKNLNLYDIPIEIQYRYFGPEIGAVHLESGQIERLSAGVTITSVISNGVELITLIPEDQLLEMEQKVLEEISNQN